MDRFTVVLWAADELEAEGLQQIIARARYECLLFPGHAGWCELGAERLFAATGRCDGDTAVVSVVGSDGARLATPLSVSPSGGDSQGALALESHRQAVA